MWLNAAVSFLMKALTAAAERLLYFYAGKNNEKLKQAERALDAAKDRNAIDIRVAAKSDSDLDSGLENWMRDDRPDER